MITNLHTLSLASITHHTNSPRVRLRRPPRARPQLTRPPLPAPVLCRPPRPPELRPSARPPVLAARCPTIARHPPSGAPPDASATPAASTAAAHPPATARPPPAGHEREARRACGSVVRHERGRSSSGRRCSAAAARPDAAPPAAPAGAAPVRSPARPSSQRAAQPSPATRRPARLPPRARAQLTRPPATARRAAGHKRDARRRCQSRETIAVLRPSIVVDGEKGIHANRNFLPCSLCKTSRKKNFLFEFD